MGLFLFYKPMNRNCLILLSQTCLLSILLLISAKAMADDNVVYSSAYNSNSETLIDEEKVTELENRFKRRYS
jgi:hypothetical protein